MGIDLGLARQQLSGKRKKSFEQKLREKNARKTARRRGIKQRKQVEEPKSFLSSNTVFYGILALILIAVVYIARSSFNSVDDSTHIAAESTQEPPAAAQRPGENSIGPIRQSTTPSAADAASEGGLSSFSAEVNDNFFIDVNVVTTFGGKVHDATYYQLDNTLGSQTIASSGNLQDNFGLPTLEITLQNIGDSAVSISELVFSNIVSTPVVTPDVIVSPVVNLGNPNDKFIVIENEGWGTLRNNILKGALLRNGRRQSIPDITIDDFDGLAKIDASAVLNSVLGISTPEQGEEVLFTGTFTFDYYSTDDTFVSETKEISCRLVNTVSPETVAGEDTSIRPESVAKRAVFEPEKQNYSVKTPFFKTIEPGEISSILVVIGTVKSSDHEFEIELKYNREQTRNLGQFNLSYYLPRSKNKKINELLP